MNSLIAGALVAAGLMAQSGPPPTYDYDLAMPGTQGPTPALLNGYTYRRAR